MGARVAGVVVRRAEDTDADRRTLVALRRAWDEEDVGGPVDDPAYEDRAVAWLAANRSHRLAWLAEADGVPIGFVTVVIVEPIPRPGRPDPGWGYVHHFFVRPDHRSAGVGAALLDAVVAEARHRGWQHLVLHPRPRSMPFYERHGFGPANLVYRTLA